MPNDSNSGLLGAMGGLPIIGGLIQGFMDQGTARQNTDKTIQANKDLAKYQYSKDLEMWNKGNAYNAPSAQMDRLKEAGLNPNLVYGNGATGNMATQLPKYNAPTVQYNYKPPLGSLPEMLSMYQDFQVKQAQVDNLHAQRKLIEESAQNKQYINEVLGNTKEARLWDTVYKTNIHRNQADIAGTKAASDLLQLNQLRQLQPYQLELAKGKVHAQNAYINKLGADTELTRSRNQWMSTSILGKLGTDILGLVTKFIPGARGMGSVGSFRKGTFNGPRYNSAESWRRMGF